MRLFSLTFLVAIGLISPATGEIITVPFSATVTETVGKPFGITAQVGVTTVSGSFSYDPSTPPVGSGTNFGRFINVIASGFIMNVAGVTISSSDYVLATGSNVLNHGGSDYFRASADPDGYNGRGGDFRVNGIPTRGSATIDLIDTDETMFADNSDALALPSQERLAHADFFTGFLSDDFGTGGASQNYLAFRSAVPEPNTTFLAALVITALLLDLPNRSRTIHNRSQTSQSCS